MAWRFKDSEKYRALREPLFRVANWLCVILLALILCLLYLNVRRARVMSEAQYVEPVKRQGEILLLAPDVYDSFNTEYLNALEALGEDEGLACQRLPEPITQQLSLAEQIELARKLEPDVLLFHADTKPETREALQRAIDDGLRVIGLLEEELLPPECVYIGPNTYALAANYAERLTALKPLYGPEVMIIAPPQMSTSSRNYPFLQQLRMSLQRAGFRVRIAQPTNDPQMEWGERAFVLEELLYDWLTHADEQPDFLICLSLEDSLTVIRGLVDNNYVGQLGVLAYNEDEEIQDALKNHIVDGTMVLDPRELAEQSIQAAGELLQQGRSSAYQVLPVHFLDAEDVATREEQVVSDDSPGRGEEAFDDYD